MWRLFLQIVLDLTRVELFNQLRVLIVNVGVLATLLGNQIRYILRSCELADLVQLLADRISGHRCFSLATLHGRHRC